MSKGRAPLILVGTKADVRYDETGRAAMACNGKSIVTKAEVSFPRDSRLDLQSPILPTSP